MIIPIKLEILLNENVYNSIASKQNQKFHNTHKKKTGNYAKKSKAKDLVWFFFTVMDSIIINDDDDNNIAKILHVLS